MSSVTIGVVCEDKGHATVVTTIVDAAVLARHTWLDGILDHCRKYSGKDTGTAWYKYNPDDARDLRPLLIDGRRMPIHGHVDGRPLKPEAGMWRKVLLLLVHAEPRPDVVVLARDIDGYPERREGLNQVRHAQTLKWPFKIAFAGPAPETEAWYVSGFAPKNEAERTALTTVTKKLSFDPTRDSHRLTSHPNNAATDAKSVLDQLCEKDPEREASCLADHGVLRARGAMNGLAAFLDEVEEMIVPAFMAPSQARSP